MKRNVIVTLGAAFAAALLSVSCEKAPDVVVPEPVDVTADSYYNYAEITVPAATKTVTVEYKNSDGTTTLQEVPVKAKLIEPLEGRDAEPFAKVKILVRSKTKAQVSIFHTNNLKGERDYSVEDLPIEKKISGEFGKTRYVQFAWDFAYTQDENWQTVKANPDDVVLFDADHNHTLRYVFCYSGPASEAYYLADAYNIVDRKVTGEKYNYCGGCGNCPTCMPWGCSCGCGKVNSSFSGNGNQGGNTGTPSTPDDVTTVQLQEPAPYVTNDEDQTFYHSSGVVMFDDSWPSKPVNTGTIDADYNDVVVDYDLEAKTVSDELLASQGWREQIKVVLHLRAVGGDNPARVGLVLENFNQEYVDYIETHVTLDSWQNPHGELPEWVNSVIAPNCIHDETNATRPWIEMGQIFRMKEAMAGNIAGEYTRIDDNGQTHKTVFNPGLGYWSQRDSKQYEDGIEIKAWKNYYNTTPGYVNVDGGLITYTVIYHMKPRVEMTPEQRIVVLENMKDVVMNTNNQNFYIMLTDNKEIGLKGYAPRDSYKSNYESIASSNSYLSSETTYYGTDGKVWAFKSPTLTKHVWEKYQMSLAYPKFEAWMAGDTDAQDWFLYPNGHYLTCWW